VCDADQESRLMTVPVDIVNLAADAIGSRAQCSSINPSDGSQLGDVGSRQYSVRVRALLRSAYWNCARRQATLSLLKAARGTPENPDGTGAPPPQRWLYEYQLSSDYERARFIPALVQDTNLAVPVMTGSNLAQFPGMMANVAIPFVIAIDTDASGNQIKVLLTDWPQAQLVYTAFIQNCDLWDSEFLTAAVASLASFLVNPLNRNAQLAGEQAAIAKSLILGARISDGNEGPSSVDHVPDFIQVRGFGYLDYSPGTTLLPWAPMAFGDGTLF
jgi:hypothetical protein